MMTCPACGAQPWHIFRGRCHDCGYTVANPLRTEFLASL